MIKKEINIRRSSQMRKDRILTAKIFDFESYGHVDIRAYCVNVSRNPLLLVTDRIPVSFTLIYIKNDISHQKKRETEKQSILRECLVSSLGAG